MQWGIIIFYPVSGAFYPLQIGDNVVIGDESVINASSIDNWFITNHHIVTNLVIGDESVINASSIGSYVYVGKNCVIVRNQLIN